jgi:hypothetical protein
MTPSPSPAVNALPKTVPGIQRAVSWRMRIAKIFGWELDIKVALHRVEVPTLDLPGVELRERERDERMRIGRIQQTWARQQIDRLNRYADARESLERTVVG